MYRVEKRLTCFGQTDSFMVFSKVSDLAAPGSRPTAPRHPRVGPLNPLGHLQLLLFWRSVTLPALGRSPFAQPARQLTANQLDKGGVR